MNKALSGFKVPLIGDASVGKTSIISRFVENKFIEGISPTVGAANVTVTINIDGKEIPINLWDTAGQEEYRSLVNIYFRESNVVLIIFDLTSHKSFEDVDEWIDEIFANCGEPLPTLLIVGNKSDLEDSRKVTSEEINTFSLNSKIPYYEVSAITGENIGLLMQNVAAISSKCISLAKSQNKYKNIQK